MGGKKNKVTVQTCNAINAAENTYIPIHVGGVYDFCGEGLESEYWKNVYVGVKYEFFFSN